MKKILYFISWAVLTATDAILGFKTATTDFGIKDTILATVWALGFSLLSVPAKIIYDRLIEDSYEKHPVIGKVIFTSFSIVWLFVAYNAYTGVSELRKNDMRREQIASIKLEVPTGQNKAESVKIESQFDYRLARQNLKLQAKQDSIKFAMTMQEQAKFRSEQLKMIGETDSNGFLYFNLLLILSASICLSLAFKDESKINHSHNVSIEEPNKYTPQIEKSESVALNQPKTDDLIKEYTEEHETKYKKSILANSTPYFCNDCNIEFKNRFAYNAHMRKFNTTCNKGNFTKLDNEFYTPKTY